MNSILKKLRLKFTLSTALLAGIILFVLSVGFCATLYATTEITASRTLEAILEHPETGADDDMGRRCIAFYYTEGDPTAHTFKSYEDELNAYGQDALVIVNKAYSVGNGKFQVGNLYFRVMSSRINDTTTLYAVIDRTSDRGSVVSASMLMALIYIAAMIVVVLFFYLFSSRALAPVADSFKKQRDLVANASHELKTPLTVISTNLSVMKSEPQSTIEDNAKWVDAIDAQIQRMNGLIVNMLQLSKMENVSLPKTDLNFSEIVEGACLCFDAVCFEKGITLMTDITPDIHVAGDKDSLERLVTCLLDNATKYCGDKGKIGLKLVADKKVRMYVMNTGNAISDDDAKHVFDRFYRTDGARQNTDGNSFGLGLAIAQATAFAHGGEILCKGIKDKGTVFEVVLPVLKPARKEKTSAHHDNAQQSAPDSSFDNLPAERSEDDADRQ